MGNCNFPEPINLILGHFKYKIYTKDGRNSYHTLPCLKYLNTPLKKSYYTQPKIMFLSRLQEEYNTLDYHWEF